MRRGVAFAIQGPIFAPVRAHAADLVVQSSLQSKAMALLTMMTSVPNITMRIGTLLLAAFLIAGSATAQSQDAGAQAVPAKVMPASPTALQTPAKVPSDTAQPPPAAVLPPEVNDTISKVVGTMEGAEKTLTAITSVDTDLGRLRDEIDSVIAKTTQTADGLRPRLADVQSQINRLGPVPGKDDPPEAPSAAAERARLAAESSELSGAIKTLEITWWRARQAIDKITELRLQLFVRSLTERMSSPLFPALWANIANAWPAVSWRLNYNVSDWTTAVQRQAGTTTLIMCAALLLYGLLKLGAHFLTHYRPHRSGFEPTFFERAASAAWIAPVRALPGIATALFTYAALDYIGLLYYPTAAPAGAALLRAILIFIAVGALLDAVFAPGQSERRLVSLSNRAARRISLLLKTLAAIYAADLFFSAAGQILYFPLSISVVQSLIASIGFASVLVGLLLTPFERFDEGNVRAVPRDYPRWLKVPLWIAAGGIILACLFGYVALGRFLAQQIMMTGVIALVATLLYLAIRAFTRESSNGRTWISLFFEEQLGLDADRRRQLGWLTESVLTVGLALVALPLMMLQWGFAGADIRDWIKSLLFGFEIGQFKISLVRIIVGIVLFVLLLFATRLLQSRLRETVLQPPRMDPGIANSIYTAVGYAGTILAAMVAISYAGFDITNLAIVAGALSVGIGFGLQSIVNNFVSGLILLIERPVKVGDWIVVGSEQGTVKNISVRSTEVETFDRASLIVPNSELITGRVLNWTHRNALGRVVLKFTAGPDANPRQVIDVLTKCAINHPDILREPEPLAVFEGYTATATEYSLRVLLPDIKRGLRVQSDLRIAVFEALRSSGVEAPETEPSTPPLAHVT
jgi:potassium efflux system protein